MVLRMPSLARHFGQTNLRSYTNGFEDGSALRRAHASEIFRSSFYKAKRSDVTLSCLDFDQLVVSEKVRPSLFTSLFELSGKGLGLACRLSPSKACSNLLTEAIDDATISQFNDIIRDIKSEENRDNNNLSENGSTRSDNEGSNCCEDVKETIKYHRSIRSSTPTGGEDIFENLGSPKLMLTTTIYNILNVTTKL